MRLAVNDHNLSGLAKIISFPLWIIFFVVLIPLSLIGWLDRRGR